jgi:hypothetical protein
VPTSIERGVQIFNLVMFGGTAAFGPDASLNVSVTKGDQSSLMDFLAQQGVEAVERQRLIDAIEADEDAGGVRPGPGVLAWLGSMSLKLAASGARVGEGTAAAVIGAAIARYLGVA